jgi:hypothetical protein
MNQTQPASEVCTSESDDRRIRIGLDATTTARTLYVAAKEVCRAAEKQKSRQRRAPLPILTHVLITASRDGIDACIVALTCTDLRKAKRKRIVAAVRSSGLVAIPARLFRDITMRLRDIGNSEVTLRHEVITAKQIYDLSKPGANRKWVICNEHRLIIECGACQFSLVTMTAEDFPSAIEHLIERWDTKLTGEISPSQL